MSQEPLAEEDLQEFEESAGPLPREYRALLLRENGGIAQLLDETDDFVFFSISDTANDLREEWYENRKKLKDRFLAIAESRGNHKLLLDLKDGSVVFRKKVVAGDIDEFLEKNCAEVVPKEAIIDCIDNRNHAELERLLKSGQYPPDYREGAWTLAQHAVVVLNDRALELLGTHGFDFSGALHLLLKLRQANLIMIRALLAGGADLEERNADGLRVTELDSPWIEDIVKLAAKREG